MAAWCVHQSLCDGPFTSFRSRGEIHESSRGVARDINVHLVIGGPRLLSRVCTYGLDPTSNRVAEAVAYGFYHIRTEGMA